ncbi:MAG: 6,7-dimethyl-8-ribityllumazine synthase [Phyllobacteriaceae bacterium]|nr:6,7-dimethyl-8-ribityllumazine synthase [Phyllobacteriaceae bacterium]
MSKKKNLRVLVVEARFYDDMSDALLDGAKAALDIEGVEHEVVTVPGALEIPGAIAMAMQSGEFDGYVALGVVIRGETYHFDIVANESARGIMDLTVRKHAAIGNGVLTCETDEQAWARARRSEGDKGGFAARAALTMIGLKKRFGA